MTPIEGVTPVVEAVAQDLRHRLFRGELGGGTPLTEAGLAERYAVARPTAKAAIEKLVGENLLTRGPHRSATVPVLGTSDARDIARTRADIEGIALQRLAQQRRVPDEARRASARIVALDDPSLLDVIAADLRFHAALVAASGSDRLSRIHLGLVTEARLCAAQLCRLRMPDTSQFHAEHVLLLELIEAGDGPGALSALEHHLPSPTSERTQGATPESI